MYISCSFSRSNSPASTLVNGNAYSPHMPRKRESSASPIDQEYKKNVDFLKRGGCCRMQVLLCECKDIFREDFKLALPSLPRAVL